MDKCSIGICMMYARGRLAGFSRFCYASGDNMFFHVLNAGDSLNNYFFMPIPKIIIIFSLDEF
jgi:hypothetical protein